jgi:hypothetical protein
MLFDLTGRGRRRTVRIVYSGLALLFLLGFVGFGVGSFGGGGVAELFGEGKGNVGETDYSSQVKKARKLTEQQPSNAAAWSGLIHYTLLQSRTGENYNSTENAFGPKAQPLLLQVQSAWQHYLKLTPHHPSSELAAEVLLIYATPGGLPNPPEALKALKIEIAGRPPSATLEYRLAEAAYAAHDVQEGDLAAKKAVALAPAGERTILQNYLSKAKATAAAQLHGTKTGTAPGGQTVTVPASQLPKGATSGQTVTLPASALKGIKGVTTGSATTPAPAATSPAPAPGTTAPKK